MTYNQIENLKRGMREAVKLGHTMDEKAIVIYDNRPHIKNKPLIDLTKGN